jgi:hypothetical protein
MLPIVSPSPEERDACDEPEAYDTCEGELRLGLEPDDDDAPEWPPPDDPPEL